MDTPHVFIRDVLPAPHRDRAVAAPRRRSLPAAILVLSLAALHPIGTALTAQITELATAPPRGPVPDPDAVVALAILAAGLLAALWYAVTGLALLLSQLVRRDLGVSRWGAPFARRLALGAGLGLLAIAPAQADAPDDVSWGAVAVLRAAHPGPAPAGATPDTGPTVAPVAAPAPAADVPSPVPAADPGAATHVVVAGECLWTIAAHEFATPSDAAVARRVGEWVQANPHLAANPDLIHPGEELVVPAGADR